MASEGAPACTTSATPTPDRIVHPDALEAALASREAALASREAAGLGACSASHLEPAAAWEQALHLAVAAALEQALHPEPAAALHQALHLELAAELHAGPDPDPATFAAGGHVHLAQA